MDLARALLRTEQVVHALRVTTEAIGEPGLRGKLDTWVGDTARPASGARLLKAAKAVSVAADAAPVASGVLAIGASTRSSTPVPALFAVVAVGVPLVAPALSERLGGPDLPATQRRSIVDGASYAALGRLGALGTGPAALGMLATGAARVLLGADATTVVAGAALGWAWARLASRAFDAVEHHGDVPPPVEMDDYRERRSAVP